MTAGLLATQQQKFGLNIWLLGLLLTAAAIVGNTVGYYIGFYSGPRLFTRDDSLLFKKKHLFRARDFYEKHGGQTLIIARFMPIVRTFVPVVAGLAADADAFVHGLQRAGSGGVDMVDVADRVLPGSAIPGIENHITKVIVVVVFLSLLPGIISWQRERSRATAA